MPITTPGRLVLGDILPDTVWSPGEELDKKGISKVLDRLADAGSDEYRTTLKKMYGAGAEAATFAGREGSAGLSDLAVSPRLKAMREAMRAHVRKIAQSDMHEATKNRHIVQYVEGMAPKVREAVMREAMDGGSSMALAASKGFRSNPEQITQMLFGNLQMYDSKGRAIPVPGLSGYGEGVSPLEYWAGSYTSRKGYWDQQFATAQSGYLGKKMSFASQRLRINGDDCGTTDGIDVQGDDSENVGSVLARPIAGLEAGHALRKEDLSKLKGKEIMVRSAVTCALPEGLCKKCAGKRENGDFPEKGAFVGITSSRVLSEPMMQTLALGSKHTGASASVVDDEDLKGLKEIIQFVNVPERFRGAAVLSHVDGKVDKISKAPQGGSYVHIGKERRHVPPHREVTVKPGDTVEMGDVLTDGTPSPSELGAYKGLGEARLYFATKFHDILRNNRAPGHRRHTETLARALYDRVRIVDPDGWKNHAPGDVLSYSMLRSEYSPRKGSEDKEPARALGGYLERPVLHYTIGTRMTPSVAARLSKHGVKSVKVHQDKPVFEPAIARVEDLLQKDPDWKVRLSGFGLKRSLLDAATHGSESPDDSLSYVPMLMDPTRL
jgi:DNA-directed RNA polymerase subunit beta'